MAMATVLTTDSFLFFDGSLSVPKSSTERVQGSFSLVLNCSYGLFFLQTSIILFTIVVSDLL